MLSIPPCIAAAAAADDPAPVALWLASFADDAAAPAARTAFQRGLLHIAAEAGAERVVGLLLARPAFRAAVGALDYGSLRRTALHLACQRGHVLCVELLLSAGADPGLTGRALSTLVQGRRCGALLDTASPPAASPAALASNDAVRLALDAPRWTRDAHRRWPPAFKAAVVALLSLNGRRGLPRLCRDELDLVCERAAYPVSAWV